MTGSAGGASYPAYKCGFVERTLWDTQSQTDSEISAVASPSRHTGILGDPVSWKMYTGWALGHPALKADSGFWAYPVGHPPISIRETRMPKGFRLTSETPKFDGRQEPSSWLEDYKIAVSCQRGTTTIAMQYIQLMLVGSARDWFKSLPRSKYDSWDIFTEDFVKKLRRNMRPSCDIRRTASLQAAIG